MTDSMEKKAYVFGMLFLLPNTLQNIGDKMDPRLTIKQWMLLAGVLRCKSKAPTLSEVAAQIGSSRQNVKKIASILEKQGFVVLEKDSRDARALRMHLTDLCVAHLQQREGMERRFMEEVFDGFEQEELSSLFCAIEKLEKNITKMKRRYSPEN